MRSDRPARSGTRGGPGRTPRRKPPARAGVLGVLGGATLAALLLFAEESGWLPRPEEGNPDLTRARRLEVTAPDGPEQFLLGLRVHHYRPQPQGVAVYRDLYFDTERLDLFRRGVSLRFRTRLEGGGGSQYTLHLEQESRYMPSGSRRMEVSIDLPDSLGAAGARDALGAGLRLADGRRLWPHLSDLGISPDRLRPRLMGELRRERFDLGDKGKTWFQLDHEIWVFHAFADSAHGQPLRLEDLALDVRLPRNDPQLVRRVRSLDGLVRISHGVRPARAAPFERAMSALAGA